MENKIISELPIKYGVGANKNKLVNDWVSIKGTNVEVMYEDDKYLFNIVDYNSKNKKLTINYNNKIHQIDYGNFLDCLFGKIIGKRTSDFKIEIGVILQDNKRDITIIDREYRKDKNGNNVKWYKYHCNKDNYEGWIIESNILKGVGCSVCSNKIVIKGINDIATTHPHLVKYFKNIEDAYVYTFSSGKKVLMKCPDCGFEKEMLISNLNKQGFSCNRCGDGISYPNKFMFNILRQLNIKFESEYSPKWCKYTFKNKLKQGRYDFYIPSINLIVEMDGGFHETNNTMNGQTSNESKYIDYEKDRLAKMYNIEVIRIDCNYKHNDRFKYIKNSILSNKRLIEIFDLNNINWFEVEEFIQSSVVINICNYWKLHRNINNEEIFTSDLAIIFNMATHSVSNYLKQGNKLNWCEYDSQIELIRARKKANNISKITKSKLVEIFKNDVSLGIFNSIKDLENESVKLFGEFLDNRNISAVCVGKRKTYKGYSFSHV